MLYLAFKLFGAEQVCWIWWRNWISEAFVGTSWQ